MKAGCFAWHTGEMEEVTLEDFIVLLFILFLFNKIPTFCSFFFSLLLH